MTKKDDEHFMRKALELAKQAFELGEVPIGALIVSNGKIIAKAHNETERLNDPTAHAEMLAITSAANFLQNRHLQDCTLYVTMEPCPMCATASLWAQIKRVVYGASDPKMGYSFISGKLLHPKAEVVLGVLANESEVLVKSFFKKIRK